MSDIRDALDDAYGDLVAFARDLDEERSWLPTRCPGWSARDLIHHVLGDAQRILVALVTPADAPADVDRVSYWRSAPGAPDPTSAGIRSERAMASLWSLPRLAETFAETAAGVRALARRSPLGDVVATQGHALTIDDLLATAVTEAAIHRLDLQPELEPDLQPEDVGSDPEPQPAPLAVARRTLDGLLGRTTPEHWTTVGWVLTASGRLPASPEVRDWLGADADRLPLLR